MDNLGLILVCIIGICIVILYFVRNKEEVYRSGEETAFGIPNNIYVIQKMDMFYEWRTIYRTRSESAWSNKVDELKSLGKKFEKNEI